MIESDVASASDRETRTPAVPPRAGDEPTTPLAAATVEPEWRRFWREWVRPFALVLLVVVGFRSTVVDWNHVPSRSMEPTILVGDRIVVNKLAYDLRLPLTPWRLARWNEPQVGDLVVFRSPEDGRRLVKRVVGTPGDRVELRQHRLSVNGQPAVYEPLSPATIPGIEPSSSYRRALERLPPAALHPVQTHELPGPGSSFGPLTIPEEHYFVLGDNRDESFDSRGFGFVPRSALLGRATRIALSVDPERLYRPRWQRFFLPLP